MPSASCPTRTKTYGSARPTAGQPGNRNGQDHDLHGISRLITRQFNDNSAFKDNEGTFFFGSVKGFIHFTPSEVIPAAEKMNVHLGSLEIQNEAGEKRIINCSAESETKKITLTYKQSTFSINFSALNFIAPRSVQYSYRMGNMDKEWIPIGERNTVYFAELHPGDYTFEVRPPTCQTTGATPRHG